MMSWSKEVGCWIVGYEHESMAGLKRSFTILEGVSTLGEDKT
jgi:hypothetical protein